MLKRIEYQETLVRKYYVDVECDNEIILNDFIHDNQSVKVDAKNKTIDFKTYSYPDVNVRNIFTTELKSTSCKYIDEQQMKFRMSE